jgi:TPP-dependent indolepyruvate ferredoxin oxidoreductase alpha subunit
MPNHNNNKKILINENKKTQLIINEKNESKYVAFKSAYVELKLLNKQLEILTNEYELKIHEININIKNTRKLLMKNCIHYANPDGISWSEIWNDASYYLCPGCNYHITNRHLSNVWDEDLILSFL